MSRMFSMTARVCSRMSRRVVPMASTSAPAMELSARRELVPDTMRKSPARLMCGNFPRGVALPFTTTLSFFRTSAITLRLDLDANVVQFRIEIQGVHAALAPDARQSHATEGGAQVAQEPAIYP